MRHFMCGLVCLCLSVAIAGAQTVPTTDSAATTRAQPTTQARRIQKLSEIRMRDVCILPDPTTHQYYMIGPGRNSVRLYISKDLLTWDGPQTIFSTAKDTWGDVPIVGIWAPEMHRYQDKYYLFLTFDTRTKFAEQWRDWLPRVIRGSAILKGDSPLGPFVPFEKHATTPTDMMTLDGTLWVEDSVPYMVFAHEWVQITNGGMCFMPLKADLSGAAGEPKDLFHASEAPWSLTGDPGGKNVTDGPYLYRSTSGKLFMIWSTGGAGGYTTGVAISDSGKLAGPWRQDQQPLYVDDGGHGMIFKTFDGQLMMVLHSPNTKPGVIHPHLFKLKDTGDTLKVIGELTNP